MPKPDPVLGTNTALNKLKDQIAQYNKPVNHKEPPWQIIKRLLNPYELIDKYHTSKQLEKYKIEPLIAYNNFTYIYEKNSLYPVITRAYFKLWEILFDTNILETYKDKPLSIGNLAEGPGGFIQCLIDYRNLQHGSEWKEDVYNAITVKKDPNNPALAGVQDWENYPEGVKYFDTAIFHGYKINRSYCCGNDGNLVNIANIKHFTEKDVGENKCHLITADGGIFLAEEEYGSQEYDNAQLFYAEILTALYNQRKGGVFILKIYDMYYNLTIQMLNLLGLYYNKIVIIKPKTSRPANSEKYIVCSDFKSDGTEPEFIESLEKLTKLFETWIETSKTTKKHIVNLFDFHEKPESGFNKTILYFNKYNLDTQMEKITEGLGLAMTEGYSDVGILESYRSAQRERGKEWCNTYQISHIN
jgi:hypothetical protein